MQTHLPTWEQTPCCHLKGHGAHIHVLGNTWELSASNKWTLLGKPSLKAGNGNVEHPPTCGRAVCRKGLTSVALSAQPESGRWLTGCSLVVLGPSDS